MICGKEDMNEGQTNYNNDQDDFNKEYFPKDVDIFQIDWKVKVNEIISFKKHVWISRL